MVVTARDALGSGVTPSDCKTRFTTTVGSIESMGQTAVHLPQRLHLSSRHLTMYGKSFTESS